MYIFPSSRFVGAKMSASVLSRKVTGFARLGEKLLAQSVILLYCGTKILSVAWSHGIYTDVVSN